MTRFQIIETINGQQFGEVITEFDNIEDARKALAQELKYASDANCDGPYYFFATKEDALAELSSIDVADIRESWGDERVDRYVAALQEGIASGMPFIASSTDGDCVTIHRDTFYYDNYRVTINVCEQ